MYLSSMDGGMPQDDRLLSLVLRLRSVTALVFVPKEMEGMDGPVLVTPADWELLRVLWERMYQIIPVVQMIHVWVITIEPGEIW
jgi:hypothetical protein